MQKTKLIRYTKNIAILCLVFLCAFQTNALWFEGSAPPNIFGGLFAARGADATTDEAVDMLTAPFRIITAAKGGVYNINYFGAATFAQRQAGENAITSALRSTRELAEYMQPDNTIMIFEYAVPIPSEVFALRFNHGFSIDYINAVYFTAPQHENQVAAVIFANRKTGEMLTYLLDDDDIINEILLNVDIPNQLHYERRGDTFIPRWDGLFHLYSTAVAVYNIDTITASAIQNAMLPFFDRPSAVRSRRLMSVFGDVELPVVRVYADYAERREIDFFTGQRIIKYTNINFLAGETLHSFIDSFALALNVINRDPLINNDIFLSNFTQRTYGPYEGFTFYFDVITGNFPVTINLEDAALTNYIQVTVSRNRLEYMRYAVSFEVSTSISNAVNDFNFFNENKIELAGQPVDFYKPREFSFGYIADGSGEMKLGWFTPAVSLPAS